MYYREYFHINLNLCISGLIYDNNYHIFSVFELELKSIKNATEKISTNRHNNIYLLKHIYFTDFSLSMQSS